MSDLIRQYRIQEQLSATDDGTVVYRVVNSFTDQTVALKLFPSAYLDSYEMRSLFNDRVRVFKQLKTEALIPIYDSGRHDGRPFIVMKWIDAVPLRTQLDEGDIYSIERFFRLIAPPANTLQKLQEMGIVHRRITPEAILVDADGRPHLGHHPLLDLPAPSARELARRPELDARYLAPEQVQQQSVDGRTDLYALAAVSYEMLTGRPPFTADTPLQVGHMHVSQPPEPISAVNPALPPVLNDAFGAALAKQPAQRPATAVIWVNQMVRLLQEGRKAADRPIDQIAMAAGRAAPVAQSASEPAHVPAEDKSEKASEKPPPASSSTTADAPTTDLSAEEPAGGRSRLLLAAVIGAVTVIGLLLFIGIWAVVELTGAATPDPLIGVAVITPSTEAAVAEDAATRRAGRQPSAANPTPTTGDRVVPTTAPSATPAAPTPTPESTPIVESLLQPLPPPQQAGNGRLLPGLTSPLLQLVSPDAAVTPTGWHLYSNYSVLRKAVWYEDVVYAATAGGLLIWNPPSDSFTVRTTYDGLSSNDVLDLAVCNLPTPTLVLATGDGVTLYDMTADEVAAVWSAPQPLPSDAVNAVFCAPEGTAVYLGYEDAGFSIYDTADETWTYNEETNYRLVDQIVADDRFVWLSHGFALSRYDLQTQEMVFYEEDADTADAIPDDSIEDMAIAPNGDVWFAVLDGLMRYERAADAWRLYTDETNEPFPFGVGEAVAVWPVDGTVWYTSSTDETLCPFDVSAEVCVALFEMNASETNDYIGAFTRLSTYTNGRILRTHTQDGIWMGNPAQPNAGDRLTTLMNQPAFTVNDIVTADGRIWIATDDGLLSASAVPDGRWQRLSEPLSSDWVKALAADPNGGVWAGTYRGAVLVRDNAILRHLAPEQDVRSIAVDADGVVWLGTNEGVRRRRDGDPLTGTAVDGLPTEDVSAILPTADAVWFIIDDALYRLPAGAAEGAPYAAEELNGSDVYALAHDTTTNDLFVATAREVFRLNAEGVEQIGQVDGYRITDMFYHADSRLLLVTNSAGALYQYDGTTWETFTAADGLPHERLTAVWVDNLNTVWVGANSFTFNSGGLVRYVPGE